MGPCIVNVFFLNITNKMQRYTIFLLLSVFYMFQEEKASETCTALTVIKNIL